MSPAEYHALPHLGSSAAKHWIDCYADGDVMPWFARYAAGPMLQGFRLAGLDVPPEHRDCEAYVDACSFTGSASTVLGSIVDNDLWTPDDPTERAWAEDGASPKAIREGRALAALIKTSCPIVAGLVADPNVERQVTDVAIVEGVGVKSRTDLRYRHEDERLFLEDFKLWTGWTTDVNHLISKWGADLQAAHYRLVSEALRPDVDHASALLVVNPGGNGQPPKEHWYEFPEHEIQTAMERVREALGQIASIWKPAEIAA